MTPDTNLLRLVGPETGSTLGEDLVLTELPDGSLELYTFDGRDAHALGTYPDAAAAWRAIDAIDDELRWGGEQAAA